MKILRPLKNSPSRNTQLTKNEITSIRSKYFSIKCLSGSLWITGSNGLDQTLSDGQSVMGQSNGKVCLIALTDASILIKQKPMPWYSILWTWTQKYRARSHDNRQYTFDRTDSRISPAVQYPP